MIRTVGEKERRAEMDITILFPVLDERLRLRKGIETTVEYLRKNSTIPYHLMILTSAET